MTRHTLAVALIAISASWSAAHAEPSPEQLAGAMLSQMSRTTAITLGTGPRVIDVFFDPNCPYCHRLYEDMQPWIGRQGLQIRWIPVAVLAPSSQGKAAAMLEAKAASRDVV